MPVVCEIVMTELVANLTLSLKSELVRLLGDILAPQQRRLAEQQRWERWAAMHQRCQITSDCGQIYIILMLGVDIPYSSISSNQRHIGGHGFIVTSPSTMAHRTQVAPVTKQGPSAVFTRGRYQAPTRCCPAPQKRCALCGFGSSRWMHL